MANVNIKILDTLGILGHFQNGRYEKNVEEPETRISISQHLIITD